MVPFLRFRSGELGVIEYMAISCAWKYANQSAAESVS